VTEAQLRRLVRLWARRLGIDHYRIEILVEAFDPTVHSAETSSSRDYDVATIRFQPWALTGQAPEDCDFRSFDVEELVVHELLHVVAQPMRRYWRLLQDGNYLHRDVENLADDVRSSGEEEVVDRLSKALVAALRPGSV
jgi:hypothetical protein